LNSRRESHWADQCTRLKEEIRVLNRIVGIATLLLDNLRLEPLPPTSAMKIDHALELVRKEYARVSH
jgi:hypothetical protein